MTALRRRMIRDMRIRNLSPRTIQAYVRQVARFAAHFGRCPTRLGPEAASELARVLPWRFFLWGFDSI